MPTQLAGSLLDRYTHQMQKCPASALPTFQILITCLLACLLGASWNQVLTDHVMSQ